MADTTTITKQLKFLAGFSDEDDRIITIENPKEDLTWTEFAPYEEAAKGVLIGDRYGAPFTRFKEVKYVDTYKTRIEVTHE